MTAEHGAGEPAAYLDRDALLADLDPWLRIPSISADPEHAPDVRASACGSQPGCGRRAFLRSLFGRPRAIPPSTRIGRLPIRRRRWWWSMAITTSSPLTRSSSGKAHRSSPLSAAMNCSVEARRMTRGRCSCICTGSRHTWHPVPGLRPPSPSNSLIEGEEESGSPHFADFLRDHAEELRCDVAVVIRHQRLQP